MHFDLEHIWHPYSSLSNPVPPLHIKQADGVHLTTKDGKKLIDAMASWWSVIHGYNHPELNNAATNQLNNMSHIMFGGLTHDPAIKLCQQLIDITPEPLDRIFLSDSGSVAIDVAMKMAVQFWRETGHPNKQKFIALQGGYHGDTLGSMSLCDPTTGMHHLFGDVLQKQFFINKPTKKFGEPCTEQDLFELTDVLEKNHNTIAALVLEPIVQGAGGMYFYSADYLKHAREICNKFGILLIVDEIATGFGRTGELFACNHADIIPDILCLGKALTGGYMSLAATLTKPDIANGICSGEAGAFMHGPTFMANPLACNIANTSIKLLLAQDWKKNIERIQQQLTKHLMPLQKHEKIEDIRILGAIGVIETKQAVDMHKVQKLLPELGVWLRPFGTRIYTMPPYIISNEELDVVCKAMLSVTENCT